MSGDQHKHGSVQLVFSSITLSTISRTDSVLPVLYFYLYLQNIEQENKLLREIGTLFQSKRTCILSEHKRIGCIGIILISFLCSFTLRFYQLLAVPSHFDLLNFS
jgi:hypothetical protein